MACTNRAEACGVCVLHGATVKKCNHAGCNHQVVQNGLCVKHGAIVPFKRCKQKGCTNQVRGGGLCNDYTLRVKEKDATTMAIPTNASVYQQTVTDAPAQRYKQVKVQSYLGIKSCACFISRYLNYNL